MENRKVSPKIFPILEFFIPSSVKPFSFIQAFANNNGEYHSPPIANPAIVAAKTAAQFNVEIFMISSIW